MYCITVTLYCSESFTLNPVAQLSPVLAARLQVVAFAGHFLSLSVKFLLQLLLPGVAPPAATQGKFSVIHPVPQCTCEDCPAPPGGRGLSSGEVKKASLPQPRQKTENTKLTEITTGGAPTWQGDFLLCLPVSR